MDPAICCCVTVDDVLMVNFSNNICASSQCSEFGLEQF